MKITQTPQRPSIKPKPPEIPPGHVLMAGEVIPVETASLSTKLGIAGCAVGGAVCLAQIASQVAAQGSPEGMALAAAGALGSAVAGFVLSDLASGFFHHGVENYIKPGKGFWGELSADFLSHHYFTNNLEKATLAGNMSPAAQIAAPALLGMAVLNPHYAVTAAALAMIGGGLSSRASHRWTHETQPPEWVTGLRKLGLAQSTEDHRDHHRAPWATNFCILNGSLNPILDKTHFWRKYEKTIFDVTGREPKTWKHPAVKEFALGQIDEAEYLRRYKDDLPRFKAAINWDAEKEASKRFLVGPKD